MFKFLRKHSKWILAIFGTLLMVVFLIPQAITALSRRAAQGSAVWATVGEDSSEVKRDALVECQNDLQMLQKLQQPVPGFGILDNPVQWFLLVREADEAGLINAGSLGTIPRDQLEMILARAGRVNIQQLDRTLSRLAGVRRMLTMYQLGAGMSDRRLRVRAESLFHTVEARMVAIEATADPDAAEPTQAEIAAQFEAYKEFAPEEGERGFGYRLPDRCKIEWLTISTPSVRDMVEQSDALNNIALFRYWERNWEAKKYPSPNEGATAVPEEVRLDLLKEETVKQRDAIAKFARDRMLGTHRRLLSPEGYFELPEDWDEQKIGFQALALEIQQEFPGIALPAYEAIGDRWLTMDDIKLIPGFNMAYTDKYGPNTRTGPSELVSAAREFGGDTVILVQEDITGPQLKSTDDSVILFRITDTDPSRPPHDLGEAREQVIVDLQRIAHYEQLSADANAIEAKARTEGLLAVALEHDTVVRPNARVTQYILFMLDYQLQNGYPLTPQPSVLYGVGQDVEAIKEIIDRALEIPYGTAPEDVPADQRIFVLPRDDKMVLLVMELGKQNPLDLEHYEQLADSGLLQRMMLNNELGDIEQTVTEAFSMEVLMARHNLVLKRRDTDEEEDPEAQPEEEEAEVATAGS